MWLNNQHVTDQDIKDYITATVTDETERKNLINLFESTFMISRESPLVAIIAAKLGLTSEQVDNLWVTSTFQK
jgi:hypothetical protein